MKQVTIYSSASCDWNTRLARIITALEYAGQYKYITGIQTDTTADRCILTGLLEAIHLIKKPCKLTFVTATRIASNRVGNPKGSNKELKRLLLDKLKVKACVFEFDVWSAGGDRLKSKLCEIEKVTTKVDPVDVLSQYPVNDVQSERLL